MRRQSKFVSLYLQPLEDRWSPAVINFALTMASSKLTLGGTVGGTPITQQGVNSLVSAYSGTIRVDVDFAGNTITFVGVDNAIDASVSGNWQPLAGGGAGTAPADYGGKLDLAFPLPDAFFAVRDAKGRIDSSALALTGSGIQSFPSTQTFTLTNGNSDYNSIFGTGTQSLVGETGTNAAAAGTLTDSGGGAYSLSVPISVTIMADVGGQPGVLTINGTLNGTAILPVVDLNGAMSGFDTSFSHFAGGPATKIAPTATITETGSPTLQSMTVTLQSPPDGAAESLTVDLTGLVGLSTTGYDSGTGTLKINGPGSLSNFQTALQRITYADSNANGTAGPRTVTVTATDGNNASLVRTALGTVVVPPAQVSGITVGDGTVQRSSVKSLTIAFDRKISPDPTAAAFQLQKSDSSVVNLNASVDNMGPTTKVTLTFTGGSVEGTSLADGVYNLTIEGSLINGGNFDGGTGLGSDYIVIGNPAAAPKLFRLYGDADGNNNVGSDDFGAFRMVFGTANSVFDIDGDGLVSSDEFAGFRKRFGTSVTP